MPKIKEFAIHFLYLIAVVWKLKPMRYLIYGTFGMLAMVTIIDQLIMPAYTKHGEAVPVPDVTKFRYEDAKDVLVSKGFKIVKSEERYDTQFPNGYVIEQSPRPGYLVKSGRRVYVILSKGQRRFEMPKLVDHSERDAKLKLAKYGLHLGERAYEYSTLYPSGVVTHQSIAPGVEVPMGTRVDITISLGPVPDEFTVPLVEGRTLDDAKDILARAGLKIGNVRYKVVNELLPETVVKQSIKAGTKVGKDEAVDLIVSMLGSSANE